MMNLVKLYLKKDTVSTRLGELQQLESANQHYDLKNICISGYCLQSQFPLINAEREVSVLNKSASKNGRELEAV